MPTLVVVGAHDAPDFHTIGTLLASRCPSHARLMTLPDTAHVPNYESPDLFNTVLMDARHRPAVIFAPAIATDDEAPVRGLSRELRLDRAAPARTRQGGPSSDVHPHPHININNRVLDTVGGRALRPISRCR